jgi:hypothetical protein
VYFVQSVRQESEIVKAARRILSTKANCEFPWVKF